MSRLVRTLIVVAFVLVALAVGHGQASAQLASLIAPGPLSKAHAKMDGVAGCIQCHAQARRVTAEKCLSCHQPVAERIARKTGVHKAVVGECSSCHVEHRGTTRELRVLDEKTFDHQGVTGFALTGTHALGEKQCAACHKTRSFLGLNPTCTSCHTDPHQGTLGTTCTKCHSTQAPFKGNASFDHATAKFQLTGAHKQAACTKCHTGTVFQGVKFGTCTDCHKEPHNGSLGTTCTSCHTTASWHSNNVAHEKTSFPLVGAHQRVSCATCHLQPATKMKPRADTCTACHSDPHRGAFAQDCRTCHTDVSFRGGRFDHATTKFALTGKHAGLTCEKCHKPGAAAGLATSSRPPVPYPAGQVRVAADVGASAPGRPIDFRGMKTTCVSCHDDLHRGEFGTACETCHTVESFGLRQRFTHKQQQTPFFAGQHATLVCEQCHRPQGQAAASAVPASAKGVPPRFAATVHFTGTARTCTACHTDVHLGQLGAACERCHQVDRAKFAFTIDHQTAAFTLKGKHAAVECRSCHKQETGRFPAGQGTAVRLKGIDSTCRACHTDVHLGQVGASCEKCHSPETFHIETFKHTSKAALGLLTGAHARAVCADCHKKETGSFPSGKGSAIRFSVGTTCVSCHEDRHRGTLGPDCSNCHRP